MTAANIIFPLRSQTYIDDVRVDLVTVQNEQNNSTLTNYPVESGAKITDHKVDEPMTLRIRGSITDSSLALEDFGTVTGVIFGGKSLSRDAYNKLIALKNSSEPFSIMTRRRIYNKMLFTSFSVRDTQSTGLAMDFIADCQQVLFATTKKIDLPADKIKSTPENAKDQQQSKAANGSQSAKDKESERSALLAISQAFGYFK